MTLTVEEVEEIRVLAKHQPVEGGCTISPDAMRALVKKKLAFWWDDAPCGYVLTDLGKAWLRDNPDEGNDVIKGIDNIRKYLGVEGGNDGT